MPAQAQTLWFSQEEQPPGSLGLRNRWDRPGWQVDLKFHGKHYKKEHIRGNYMVLLPPTPSIHFFFSFKKRNVVFLKIYPW